MDQATLDLLQLVGIGDKDPITLTFRRMEIAEEEIERAKKKWPLEADRIHDAFRYLGRNCVPFTYHEDLYRAHCRELIGRIATTPKLLKDTLRLGTAAECVAAMSETSMVVPFHGDSAYLYVKLSRQCMGLLLEETELHESYEGATDLLLDELRHKLAMDRDCRHYEEAYYGLPEPESVESVEPVGTISQASFL